MKVGIVGSGRIVRETLETISLIDNVECVAICVRESSEQKGREVAETYNIPKLYLSYQDFLKQDNLDFVYIGIINPLHAMYAKKALLAGKNVIVEKPFSATLADAREIATLAVERGLYLFEAITTLYCPMFRIMEERLPEVGAVRLVQCNFSQYSSRYENYLQGDVHPVFDPAGHGGTLYDINIYNLHLVVALFGEPIGVRYHGNKGYNGVDTSGMAVLEYEGFSAVCCGAKDSTSPGFAMIQGTNGFLHMKGNPNACPELEIEIQGNKESFKDPEADIRLAPEWRAFQQMWQEGNLASCHRLLEQSVSVISLLEQAANLSG